MAKVAEEPMPEGLRMSAAVAEAAEAAAAAEAAEAAGANALAEAKAATASSTVSSTASSTVSSTVSLSRANLEVACAELLAELRLPVVRACTQAQVALPGAAGGAAARASTTSHAGKLARAPSLRGLQISSVLRVGAASRMPAVGKMLEALVGRPCPLGAVNPEHAVALGAAVQAGVLEGSLEQLDVFNPLEAALIRGIGSGAGRRSQRERTGEASGSRKKKRRR